MADAANPSFFSPPFSSGNYSYIGSGVSIGGSQINYVGVDTWHDGFPLLGGIFNTRHFVHFRYIKNPNFSGSGQYESSCNLWLAGPSTYFEASFNIWASPTVLKFRFHISSPPFGTIWFPAYPGFYLTSDNYDTGDTSLEIYINPDEGGGIADVDVAIQNSLHSVFINHKINNFDFSANPFGWKTRFRGLYSTLAGTSWTNYEQIMANPLVYPNSILSGESFGSPTVETAAAQGIWPDPIISSEAWGTPALDTILSISPIGIVSGETFGLPTLTIPVPTKSALPPPSPAKTGDIRLTYDVYDQYVDFILADRDVERDPGLETAVMITLLTDKLADEEDDLPDDSGYRGGWFGDSIPVVEDYKMGTKLWLLQRAKTVSEIPARAKEYLKDGFQWMIDDEIVQAVNISVERRRDLKTTLAFTLSFVKPEGVTIFYKFYYNWEAQLLRRQ